MQGSGRGVGVVLAILTIVAGVAPASGAVLSITEIVPPESEFSNPYLEITFYQSPRPIDIAVIDAHPYFESAVRSFVSIDPGDKQVVVIHEGAWTGPPIAAPDTASFQVDKLRLADSGGGRWLAVFESFAASSRWRFDTVVPDPDDWDGDAEIPAVLDFVGYDVNPTNSSWPIPWDVEPARGAPMLALEPGDAAYRVLLDGDPTDVFRIGHVDAEGDIADPSDPVRLEPGRINIAQDHTPEPASALMLAVGAAALLTRRTRRAGSA